MLAPWKKSYYKPRQHIKKQRHYFANKDPSSKGYSFSSSHVWIWVGPYRRLSAKELMLSNCDMEKTLEIPFDCKEIKPVNPKGNQPWIFIRRTDAEAEVPILGLPDAKNQLIGKNPNAEKDWRQEEKGTTPWDGWMASLTQWTWVWVNSGRWWWTGRPGVL